MAIKFQYNKTSLQQLEKQLKVRVRTLPIIKNKESALRMEVKRCKADAAALDARLEKEIQAYEAMFALWNEFDASLIKVSDVHLGVKKIAGVRARIWGTFQTLSAYDICLHGCGLYRGSRRSCRTWEDSNGQ